jgi:transcriptional regulator with XRE-family HTH domain
MEKKTIGSFLAALRKANGLTQKQNVSDKAVSRWERDECAPDLSLIPVLAEIYGVTSDEILRGQRRDPETTTREPDASRSETKQNSSPSIPLHTINLGWAATSLFG